MSDITVTPDTPLTTPTPTEQLRRQARTVKEDLQGLGRTAKKVAKEKAATVVEEGKQKTGELYEQSREKLVAAEDRVEKYVREKPLQSVAIAAGVGALLGFLLSRR